MDFQRRTLERQLQVDTENQWLARRLQQLDAHIDTTGSEHRFREALNDLKSHHHHVVLKALAAIHKSGPKAILALPDLKRLISDPCSIVAVKVEALDTLAAVPIPNIEHHLEAYLYDPHSHVSHHVIEALARLETKAGRRMLRRARSGGGLEFKLRLYEAVPLLPHNDRWDWFKWACTRDNWALRGRALARLSLLSESFPRWPQPAFAALLRRQLLSAWISHQRYVLDAAQTLPHELAKDLLGLALNSNNSQLRLEAVQRLNALPTNDRIEMLTELHSSTWATRRARLSILGQCQDPRVLPMLREAFLKEGRRLRRYVVSKLDHLDSKDIPKILEEFYGMSEAKTRSQILHVMFSQAQRRQCLDQALPCFRRALADSDRRVRLAALCVLAKSEREEAIADFARFLWDKDRSFRHWALRGLERLNTDAARAVLRRAIKHPSPTLRARIEGILQRGE